MFAMDGTIEVTYSTGDAILKIVAVGDMARIAKIHPRAKDADHGRMITAEISSGVVEVVYFCREWKAGPCRTNNDYVTEHMLHDADLAKRVYDAVLGFLTSRDVVSVGAAFELFERTLNEVKRRGNVPHDASAEMLKKVAKAFEDERRKMLERYA